MTGWCIWRIAMITSSSSSIDRSAIVGTRQPVDVRHDARVLEVGAGAERRARRR